MREDVRVEGPVRSQYFIPSVTRSLWKNASADKNFTRF